MTDDNDGLAAWAQRLREQFPDELGGLSAEEMLIRSIFKEYPFGPRDVD